MAGLVYKAKKDASEAIIELPSSKSISNRLVCLRALSKGKIDIQNLSEARDTKILVNALQSKEGAIDIKDAGTAARFSLTTLSCLQRKVTLDGTRRMRERPIGELIGALDQLGYEIIPEGEEGKLPLKLNGVRKGFQNVVEIKNPKSSQFLSALCLIGPFLEGGLELNYSGLNSSWSYVQMTLDLLSSAGAKVEVLPGKISIDENPVLSGSYTVEADWSSAAFFYEFFIISELRRMRLNNLTKESLQGDLRLVEIFSQIGVQTTFANNGLELSRLDSRCNSFEYDFSECPDLAQPVAFTLAALKIPAKLYGLESLQFKETDRTAALSIELKKMGCLFRRAGDFYELIPGNSETEKYSFAGYNDHRMVMSAAPLVVLKGAIEVSHPEAVQKSFPGFWKEMEKLGVELI